MQIHHQAVHEVAILGLARVDHIQESLKALFVLIFGTLLLCLTVVDLIEQLLEIFLVLLLDITLILIDLCLDDTSEKLLELGNALVLFRESFEEALDVILETRVVFLERL